MAGPEKFSLSPASGPKSRWRAKPDRRRSASERGYGAAWQRLRAQVLEDEPLCQWPGCAERASVVDHILAKRWGGTDARQNLQALCGTHHRRKTIEETDWLARSQPRDLLPVMGPLVIVTGSPGSGKTTFAEKIVGRARCLDLDFIKAALAGSAIHNTASGWIAPALVLRNHSLRAMARRPFTQAIALIIGAPSAGERARWEAMLQPRAVCVMETPPDEAMRRVRTDGKRAHCVDEHVRLIQNWWARHSRRDGEIVVTPANTAASIEKINTALEARCDEKIAGSGRS